MNEAERPEAPQRTAEPPRLRRYPRMRDTYCAICGQSDWCVHCGHCEPHQTERALPDDWAIWSSLERELFDRLRSSTPRSAQFYEELKAALPADKRALLLAFDDAMTAAPEWAAQLVTARLKRYLPQFADLIEFAGPLGDELRGSEY